jgi:hypothetical protein
VSEKQAEGEETQFVTDLVEEYRKGIYTRLELFAEVFRQLHDGNVDRAICALPEDLRARFVAWAKDNYDNTTDPSDYFYIGGEGYREAPREAFFAIRRWLASHHSDET